MRIFQTLLCLGLSCVTASAQFGAIHVNCARGESLARAAEFVLPGTTLVITGTCKGPMVIQTSGLTINGGGSGVISGGGKDAITVIGARNVTLSELSVTGGNNGVVAENNAQVTLQNVIIKGSTVTGLLIERHSSANVNNGAITGSGLDGVDVESTSSLTLSGNNQINSNGVFGMFVNNGSSLTLTGAMVTLTANNVGVQVGTGASAFVDGASLLSSFGNSSIGLTMVSGAHMTVFGGSIEANSNGLQGIALDAKSGLDMDAGAQVEANYNSGDGVHLEQLSEMTIFNTPQFSGTWVPTMLTAEQNTGDGINLLTNSEILVDNVAEVQVDGNSMAGIGLDDGSSFGFGQTIPVAGVQTAVTGNNPDVNLTFTSRLTTIGNDTVGTIKCDATSLVRGPLAVACPH